MPSAKEGFVLLFRSIQLKPLLSSASICVSWVTTVAEVCSGLRHTSLGCSANVLSLPAFPSHCLQSLQIKSHLMTLPFAIYSVFPSYKVIIHAQWRKQQESPKEKIRPAFKYCFFFEEPGQRLVTPVMSNKLQPALGSRHRGTALHWERTMHKRGACEQAMIHGRVEMKSILDQNPLHETKKDQTVFSLNNISDKGHSDFSLSPPFSTPFHKCISFCLSLSFHSHSLWLSSHPLLLRDRVR